MASGISNLPNPGASSLSANSAQGSANSFAEAIRNAQMPDFSVLQSTGSTDNPYGKFYKIDDFINDFLLNNSAGASPENIALMNNLDNISRSIAYSDLTIAVKDSMLDKVIGMIFSTVVTMSGGYVTTSSGKDSDPSKLAGKLDGDISSFLLKEHVDSTEPSVALLIKLQFFIVPVLGSKLPPALQSDMMNAITDIVGMLETAIHEKTSAGTGSTNTPEAVWSYTMDGKHKANIQLGDVYSIALDDAAHGGGNWTITDKQTGFTTKISGDPHVDTDADGKNDWDFKKDMTFILSDGTKITVNTTQYRGNSDLTMSSGLTITRGDQSIVVKGLAGKLDEPLSLQMSNDGVAVDKLRNDGASTIYECGYDWTTDNGRSVGQDFINQSENLLNAAAKTHS